MAYSTHIVVGRGEVGEALGTLLSRRFQVRYHDPAKGLIATAPLGCVMHVCIPYSDGFVGQVKKYRSMFNPRLTVIHSTVKVGTTRLVGEDVAYSFARGRHPHLAEQMGKFTKHIGCSDPQTLVTAFDLLTLAGFDCQAHDNPEAVELGKLWDTTYYGVCIAVTKLMAESAEHFGVEFEELSRINRSYNAGMRFLKEDRFVRPELEPVPGPIGGHCVVPNARLLEEQLGEHPLLEAVINAR